MGRRISKEFLHPSILEGVNDKIGNLDSLETDAKGNMVQAINELVEKLDNSAEIEAKEAEIAEGKELIANAVGEPLTAEESFDEMSNDINSLLSTFKTNMMNNGVTVNNSDKFKQLIDKITTLADGEGKGVKFATGNISNLSMVHGTTITIPLNLEFTPTYIFIKFDNWYARIYNYELESSNMIVSNIVNAKVYQYDTSVTFKIQNITKDNCTIKTTLSTLNEDHDFSSSGSGVWYAIGVGEEDTTLRDSLASILQEEGVSVTEEDTMASLIGKVDEEFDRQVVPQGTAVAGDVASGKTFINSTGKVVTGNGKILKTWTTNASNQYTVTGASESTSTLKIVINHSLGSKPSNVTLKISALDATSTDRDNNFTGLNFVISSLYHNSDLSCAQLLGTYSGYRYMGAYIGDITATSFTIFIGIGYWSNQINTVKLTVSSITCYA